MKKRTVWTLTCASFVLASLALGCGSKEGDGGATNNDITPQARQEAATVFKTVCTPCHGDSGHGDGPLAKDLDPKPRTFSDKEWQKSVTDEHIAKVIVEGGESVGKSKEMKPNPNLADKPLVVKALIQRIRRYGK
ncbi:MAG: hypothetical protein KDC95_18905 [Planctomycetes bacterium]|nr:hypothetical protein [Planctomycetota bacterium]